MTTILVLQHIRCEPPGVYEDILIERGATIKRVEVDEGEPFPAPGTFDAIVAMGGPMSVNDVDDHPWLVAEKALIAESVEAGLPYFGACLGVQLLAAALGARVWAGRTPEVGVLPVTLTADGLDDPVIGPLGPSFPTLQWHGDSFDLPPGATLLASSPAYPHQAFCHRNAYGVQFHLEVSTAMAIEWSQVPAYSAALDSLLGPGSFPSLLADFEAARPTMAKAGRALFSRWTDLIGG